MAESTPKNSFAIAEEEVRTTAEMARLHIKDGAELSRMTVELSRILQLAASLSEVDVQGVPPTTHAVPMACPLRDDAVGSHLDIEGTLKNAPATEATFFTVPAILHGGDGEG